MSYNVIVTENGQGRYQQEVLVGERPHRLVADEPQSVGGDDAGPAPFDFLMVGLGACKSMTIRMYVNRKEWSLEKVSVALGFDQIEDGEGKKTERIECLITLTGNLTREQRERLLEIAEKCPTHRVLQRAVRIDTRLAD